MKKILAFTTLIVTINLSCVFSQTATDIFKTNTLIWYGLDFSKIKLIGHKGFKDPADIVSNIFPTMNSNVLEGFHVGGAGAADHKIQYDLSNSFPDHRITYDMKTVTERNRNISLEGLVIDADYRLSQSDISGAIADYESKNSKGIGVVMLMESFNKLEGEGYMHIVFFDIASRKVLLTERFKGRASGYGFINYWSNTYFIALQDLKKKMKNWKKEYLKK